MYRRDLKMARGEGDSGLKSHFVERVVKLPIVHVAWDYASNTYSHIKESNRIVNFTLTNAEKSVTFVAKPVALKLGKQIQAVDNLACVGLETLEERVPFIKKPAEEIIGDTRKLYTSTVYSRLEGIKKLGNDTVKSATDFGLKQATAIFGESMVQSVISSIDNVLAVTQNYVDVVLPPTTDEKKENNQSNSQEGKTDKETTLTRLTNITNIVRRRAYTTALLKFEYLQEKSIDVFVIYPFTVIELTKSQFDSAFQYANNFMTSLLQRISIQGTDTSDQSQIQQQLLHLTRVISGQVASIYFSLVNSSSSNENQEPTMNPAVLNAVIERVMLAYGTLKSAREVLPMFLYGFLKGLEEHSGSLNKTESTKTGSENGSVVLQTNHNHFNNIRDRPKEEHNAEKNSNDRSILEENEEQ